MTMLKSSEKKKFFVLFFSRFGKVEEAVGRVSLKFQEFKKQRLMNIFTFIIRKSIFELSDSMPI